MSIYAAMAGQGVQTIASLMTEDTATYNAVYAAEAKKAAIAEAKHTAELNISAIAQDKITSNTAIRMKQDQAEAAIKVSAATAGVEGGSVEDALYNTERSEAFALNAANKQAEQQTEQQLSIVGSQQSALLAVNDPEPSFGDFFAQNLTEVASQFEMSDLATTEALFSGGGGEDKPKAKTFDTDFNASNINVGSMTA